MPSDEYGPSFSTGEPPGIEGKMTSEDQGTLFILILLFRGYPTLNFGIFIPFIEPLLGLLILRPALFQSDGDLGQGDFSREIFSGLVVLQISVMLYQLARVSDPNDAQCGRRSLEKVTQGR